MQSFRLSPIFMKPWIKFAQNLSSFSDAYTYKYVSINIFTCMNFVINCIEFGVNLSKFVFICIDFVLHCMASFFN